MVQLFIGHKPGVGPVLKSLKYNSDDPLTLANTAYDRYYYNSENSNLSYVFTTNSFDVSWGNIGSLNTNFDLTNSAGAVVISGRRTFSGNTLRQAILAYRLNNIFPNGGYVPLAEFREADLATGKVQAGSFQRSQYVPSSGAKTITISQQFYYQILKVTSYDGSSNTQTPNMSYNGRLNDGLSRIPIGEWCAVTGITAWNDDVGRYSVYPNYWDLPADSSPMRSFSYTPGLLGLEANNSKFVLARPGYDVSTGNQFGKIIDSNRSPALCVMNGTINNIAPSASRTIQAPPGITLSQRAVVDVMFRVSGQTWHVPSVMTDTSGYGTWRVEYSISGNSITIFNSNKDTIDVRYVVFNVDAAGNSTGGNQVLFSGNDGTQDYVQIKKPGTSDPASHPNDILFDTRYPQFQIIKEGYVPISSFVSSSSPAWKGDRKYRVDFDNAGFVPYLKFSIVFPNCVTAPYHYRELSSAGVSVSNVAMMADVFDNYVEFFASPQSGWSFCYNDETSWVRQDYGARIQGVRYYIFGIAQ